MKPMRIQRPVHLRGEKVILRDMRVEDVTQDYVDWMNDPEVVKFTESRFAIHDLNSTTEFVMGLQESPNNLLLGMFDPEDDRHFGNIKLGPVQWYHGLSDIGLIVGRKSFWGRGIASESITLLCEYAFTTLGLHKVTASCYASNRGSAKAFLNAGFQQEGKRPLHVKGESGWEDVLEFGKIGTLNYPESAPL